MMCYVDQDGNIVTLDASDALVRKRLVLDPSQYKKNSRAKRDNRKPRREYSQCELEHLQCCGIREEDQEALFDEYELALENGPEMGELFLRGLMHVPPTNFSKLFTTHIGPRIRPPMAQKCIYCCRQESNSPSTSHSFNAGKCPKYTKAMKEASEFWGKEMINDEARQRKRVQYFLRTKTGFQCQVCHDLFANTFNLTTHGHAMNV